MRFHAAWFALLLGLAGALLLPAMLELERKYGLEWLFHLRGPRPPPDAALIVALGQESAERLGLSTHPDDWPRSLHARLIERLTAAGATAIALDLHLDRAGDPREDAALAAAMARSGRVFPVGALRGYRNVLGGDAWMESVTPPIPEIARAVVAHPPFFLPKSERVDGYWTFREQAGEYPTLPGALLQFRWRCGHDRLAAEARGLGLALADLPAAGAPALPPGVLTDAMRALRSAAATHPSLGRAAATRADCPGTEAVRALYAGPEARFLDFYGPARSIPTLAYHAALEADPGVFRGKVVLVGHSNPLGAGQDRVRDDYRTVFSQGDGQDMSGVEIAATAYLNLLEQRSVHAPPLWAGMALMFLWGGLIAGAASRRHFKIAVLFSMTAAAAYLGAALALFTRDGLWLPLLSPLFVILPLALLLSFWGRYRDTARERESISVAFAHFLPQETVERLVRNAGRMADVNQTLFGVCLATDAEQYTALSERLDPNSLGRLINRYLAELFAPVERRGGVVSNVVGDSMLAVWAGAGEDRALRRQACLAALEMDAALNRPTTREEHRLPTRIGLHAGELLLGTVGAGSHYEYRPVGDIVNTASRIEGLCKHLGVRLLVSDDVLADLDGLLTRPLGRFLLKGKTQPVAVHELLAEADRADAGQRRFARRFAEAMAAHEQGDFPLAARLFGEFLGDWPKDGPAAYHLARCRSAEAAHLDGVIRLDSK